MSEQEWLGDVPIYRWDPKEAADEGEDLLTEGRRFCFKDSDGEIVATGVIGPRVKTTDDEGDLWSISLAVDYTPEGGA